MTNKLNFKLTNLLSEKNTQNKTTRRCFIKRTAAFTGLTLAPLKLTSSAFAIDLQMNYLINNISAADRATAGYSSACSTCCSSASSTCCCSASSTCCTSAASTCCCSAISRTDINGDGTVDENDLREMARDWLSPEISARSNIDCSHTSIPGSAGSVVAVDYRDFAELAKYWQQSY